MAAYVTRFGPTKSVWVARSPPGFAFIEFETEQDAQACIDVVHDARLGHQNVTAQFAKTNGPKEPPPAKPAPSCRHRAVLKNLPASFSWRELQDEMRQLGRLERLDVIYADMDAQGDGHVEFASAEDLDRAVKRLHGTRLDGNYIVVYKEAEGPPPASSYDPPPASSYDPPPASSYDPPPASSYDPPPASSYDDRGGGYDARAPAGSGAYGSGTYGRSYDRSYNRGYSDMRDTERAAYNDTRGGSGAYGSGTYDRGYDRSYNRGYSDMRDTERAAYNDTRGGSGAYGSGTYDRDGSGTYDRGYDRSYNRGYSRYDDVRQDSRYEGAYGSYRERERDGLYARGGGGSGGYDGARSNGYGYQNYEQGGHDRGQR
jgi:RNA recognition motif-containing protein